MAGLLGSQSRCPYRGDRWEKGKEGYEHHEMLRGKRDTDAKKVHRPQYIETTHRNVR
jgi:hypothetical protein